MKIQNFIKMMCVTATIGLFGCGGGGGSSAAPPATVTKTTISGKLEYPSMSSLVAKSVGSVVPDALVTVQAYTLEGEPVGTPVTPTFDNSVPDSLTDFTKRVYTYVLPNIPVGKDYVVRAKRIENGKTQELKKLIEKADVVEGMLEQKIDSVSTAAVVVASQKLSTSMGIAADQTQITLGDPLPSLGANTVANLSESIVTDVAPKSLENSIQAAKEKVTLALADSGGISAYLSSLSQEDKKALADLVNMLNIVVASVANNTDPAKVLAGTTSVDLSGAAAGQELKLLSVDTGGTVGQAAATATITQTIIQETVTSAVVTYVPPRVKLVLSTDATSLYGLVIDVTIPVDAKVRVDATGKIDMALLVVPAGVNVDVLFDSTTRKMKIVLASSTPLPSTLLTLNFDRTLGKVLTSADFPHFIDPLTGTSDIDGNVLSTAYTLTKSVTSSGSMQ